jgi:hypothetical protein
MLLLLSLKVLDLELKKGAYLKFESPEEEELTAYLMADIKPEEAAHARFSAMHGLEQELSIKHCRSNRSTLHSIHQLLELFLQIAKAMLR